MTTSYNNEETKFNLSSFTLHILAMLLMLGDHIWGTTVIESQWLTILGRLAFPIFAFLIVEGFYHTKHCKKYIKRMFLFAVISEIPFNYMLSGRIFYLFHQNVLWNFGIALLALQAIEKIRQEGKKLKMYTLIPIIILVGYILATITFTDYYGAGFLTVMVFYFFRGQSLKHKALQLAAMIYINCFILQGYSYVLSIGSFEWWIPQQGMAVFALIPIWLYKGRQGPYNKVIKNIYYWFYPVHALVLALLASI